MKCLFTVTFCVFSLELFLVYSYDTEGACKSRDYGHGSTVCVCNEKYCDDLLAVQPPEVGKAQVISSNKDGVRWDVKIQEFQEHGNDVVSPVEILKIDRDDVKLYQKIIGFGGAFTDASGLNIQSVPEPLQEMILRAYYSPNGLEYSLGRIPVGGTDFSTRPYTYDDLKLGDVDPLLSKFSLTPEDLNYKIPLVKRALKMSGNPVKLFASAWGAPGWMKTNGKIYGKGKLLPQFYSSWAQYHVLFLKSYESHNISFWGLTTQNEPTDGLVKDFSFNSIGWTAEEQAAWIGEHLGPALHNSSYGTLKIMILDDNRFLLTGWVKDVMSNKQAATYVSGVAIHWYLDFVTPANVLDYTHKSYPDLFLLYTEACTGQWPWQPLKVVLGSWVRAQNYAADIIENLQHWVSGWTDWNLALDMKGGPNWAKNFVDSPIIVNAKDGEFYKQPMYYALAHFTKALPEGSQRVEINSSLAFDNSTIGLSYVGFVRPDNATSLILLNKSHEKIKIQLQEEKVGVLDLTLEAFSITTVTWKH
ncbi:lysosomal acid glucosylceramidase-like isoform X2 [Macrobrachium rosenbergii]|uniref:lysosomal acid glucosylceramidase-like isoform X2 n=1 Tax=Macrobrachium rosenbergii TaxID=79674 RepID=UPI0034D70E42